MPNPKHDRRSDTTTRQRIYTQRQPDIDDATIVQDRPVAVQRRAVPQRATALRKAGVAAPQTTGEQTLVYRQQPTARMAVPALPDDEIYEMEYEDVAAEEEADKRRVPTSTRRYTGMQPAIMGDPYDTRYPMEKQKHWITRFAKKYPLLAFASGVVVAATVLTLGINVLNLGNEAVQRWNYGPTPVYQVDQAVGHNGDSVAHPSHFMAFDVHGEVYVVEVGPSGTNKLRYYYIDSLFSSTGANPVITLQFADVNHDGKLDMEIEIPGLPTAICINDGSQFENPVIAGQ